MCKIKFISIFILYKIKIMIFVILFFIITKHRNKVTSLARTCSPSLKTNMKNITLFFVSKSICFCFISNNLFDTTEVFCLI